MKSISILKCPICSASLEKVGNSLFCKGDTKRHCYDFASSGYVNLLTPGKEKNAHTGDEKTMITARREFLDTGAYFEISRKAAGIIASLSHTKEPVIIDAGCGEGYHSCNIASCLEKEGFEPCLACFDASKHGADVGAKRARRGGFDNVLFSAGNIFTLPVKDFCADFSLSMFAPIAGDETLRYLKDGGYLIVVSSGERHLWELRELLYEKARESSGEVKIPEGFEKVLEDRLTYTFTVEKNSTLKSLFVMTPFYYRTSLSDKEKLEGVTNFTVTADVKYTVMKKAK